MSEAIFIDEEPMEDEDKYLYGDFNGLAKVLSNTYILNKMWNAIAEEKKKWQKHSLNHTEDQYRQICADFVDKFREKNKEVAVAKGLMKSEIRRRKTINDMYEEKCAELEKAKEDIRDLKRTADKLPGYKKEFERLSKKMRSIEDYVSSYDFDTNHRDTITAEEYFDTDPDLRMFFTLE